MAVHCESTNHNNMYSYIHQEPTVFFSDYVTDRVALESATLGCCMYTASAALLQVSCSVIDAKRKRALPIILHSIFR